METCGLAVLEARSLRAGCRQGRALAALGEDTFLPHPQLWQFPGILGVLGLWLQHPSLCLCLPTASPLCVSLPVRAAVTGFRAHSNPL